VISIGFLSIAAFKRFAARNYVTLRVMGGKSGKIAARNGNEVAIDGKVGGKNGKVRRRNGHLHAASTPLAQWLHLDTGGHVWRGMRLFRCQRGGMASWR
jgi:hypothetical protein